MTSCAEAAGGLVTAWGPWLLMGLLSIPLALGLVGLLAVVVADILSAVGEYRRERWWSCNERRTSLRWWDRRR